MSLMGIARFERFFRIAAGLDVDKSDLKRYSDFVSHKLYHLLLRGEAAAKANARDVIEPFDLPITKGLQERIHEFRTIASVVRSARSGLDVVKFAVAYRASLQQFRCGCVRIRPVKRCPHDSRTASISKVSISARRAAIRLAESRRVVSIGAFATRCFVR